MIRDLAKNAGGKFPSAPDITLGRRKLKAELIPPALIGARFFAAEQAEIDQLGADLEVAAGHAVIEGWRPTTEASRALTCPIDGLVAALPSGKIKVGTVWLPPLTDMTTSAASG